MLVTDSSRAISSQLWEALAQDTNADAQRLIEAARMEIWERITFWDDVYFTIRQAQNKLAS